MRFVWKGKLRSLKQLPKGQLPPNAVKFREPQTPLALNIAAMAFLLPAAVVVALILLGKTLLHGATGNLYSIWGFVLALAAVLPHEFLHAVCFPGDAEVECRVWLPGLSFFVVCTAPISKSRFIFLSLLPNLVFGLLPLLIWMLLPPNAAEGALFSFGALSLAMGVGDYLNVWNAARQVPKGALTQLSGFHSYWFFPEKPAE